MSSDHEILIKKREIEDCMIRCKQLQDELSLLENKCREGGQCEYGEVHWTSSRTWKTCKKCGEDKEMPHRYRGGRRRRKSKRKTKKRRRKKKTKRRRRRRRR